jgi:hypothetical protein
MPIYERRGGDGFRVTVYTDGRQYEKICRGSRDDSLRLEETMWSVLRGNFEGDDPTGWPALGGIYVIQAGPLGEIDPIKIGISKNIRKRLRHLQIGLASPIRLLLAFEGDRQTERALHQKFAHLRVSGEWFRPDADMRQWVRGYRQEWLRSA